MKFSFCSWVVVLALMSAGATETRAASQTRAPDWLAREMSEMVADGGRWITDNSAYRGEQEPFDQYGMEWHWAIGRNSITGRLFGLRDSQEVGTFWEFRIYWHPGKREAVIVQYGGDGRMGEGPLRATGNTHETESIQVFYAPDGSRTRLRHLAVTADGTHRTQSFDEEDGKWVARRTYVWKRTEG